MNKSNSNIINLIKVETNSAVLQRPQTNSFKEREAAIQARSEMVSRMSDFEIADQAPESPDPRCHHRSKLIIGNENEVKQSEEEREKEFARLRKQYLHNRAATVLHEQKFGESHSINYNEFC